MNGNLNKKVVLENISSNRSRKKINSIDKDAFESLTII